jgi:hypothetical protein
MKPAIQIATAELMVLRNDYSISFAKTRLALTPPDLLNGASISPRKLKADSVAAHSLLEDDTEILVRNLKAVEESYGIDMLTLTVACAYLERLLKHSKVIRYLERNQSGVLETLHALISELRSSRKHISDKQDLIEANNRS